MGNLTQELRQPSNPFTNLSQHALLHCQINALKNIIPDLEELAGLPQNVIDLSNGYILLQRCDTMARPLLPIEELALVSYLQALPEFSEVILHSPFHVITGQIAQSLWVEQSKTLQKLHMARNVKVN